MYKFLLKSTTLIFISLSLSLSPLSLSLQLENINLFDRHVKKSIIYI